MKNFIRFACFICIAALVYWLGDAAIDSLTLKNGTFLDHAVFAVTTRELLSRLFIICCIFLAGVILSRTRLKRNRALDELSEHRETLCTITNAARDAILVMDENGNISFWNRAAERIFGYSAHEAIGKNMHELVAPKRFLNAYQEGFSKFAATGEGPAIGRTIELTARRKDGAEFPVELSLAALQLKEKWHAVGVLRDISERKKTEEELRNHRERLELLVAERTEELNSVNELLRNEIADRARTEEALERSESFLNSIFDSFHDPFSIIDTQFRIVRFNNAYAAMRNRMPKDLFGKQCYETLYGRSEVCEECIIHKTFQSKDPCAKEKKIVLPDGTESWFEIYTYPIFGQGDRVTHVIQYARDITTRKKEEEEKKELIKTLNHLSTTDALTGLANRRALNEKLLHEIDRAIRYDDNLSLILCDVDKFKHINDTYGHTIGDKALKAVAEKLSNTLRKADIIGRYGGDEFMIILPSTTLDGAKTLAEKIRAAVTELSIETPYKSSVKLSVSIGVASCCTPMENIDTLVALADTALYTSKEAGRNRVTVLGR